jgi:hypothetical protein
MDPGTKSWRPSTKKYYACTLESGDQALLPAELDCGQAIPGP